MLSPAVRVPDNLKTSLLIGLLALLVYNANLRSISAGDTYPARYLPFAVWHYHTVLLDPVSDGVAQGRRILRPRQRNANNSQSAFWIVQIPGGHTVSLYPLVTPLLVTPLYLPAVVYLSATGWDQQEMDRVARIMEKLAASLMAATSVALFYVLLRRRTGMRSAIVLTSAYAFGTTTWVVSSQALWQHGAGELLIVLALLLLTARCTPARAAAAGLVLGLIACNRPPDSLVAAALGLYGLWWSRRLAALMVAGALLPAIPLLIYNLGVVGNLAGAYGLVGKPSFFEHNLFSGLAGLLISPTRGLFVFCPFLLFVPLYPRRVIGDIRTRGLTLAALAAVALQLVLYAKADWRQGASWGPRWLTDLIPLLVWMLPPVLDSLARTARTVFIGACAVAIVIEAIGAFWYTGASDGAIFAVTQGPNQLRAAWDPANAPFIAELRHPASPAELMADVRGFLDVLNVSDGANGRQIDLAGWALASGHSACEVSVLLDGRTAGSTTTFLTRPDVTNTLGVRDPTGWQITIPARDLSAGEHVVAVTARGFPGGELRLLTERHFTLPPLPARGVRADTDLTASAARATEILTSHQRQPGYWLTSYTSHLRFEQPKQEMNTYLTAVIVDVINPVAKMADLQPSVRRARSFLAAQIEPDGLVRYHGLPDAPTIGTLGCIITPDADDTSLVWRIAPGHPRGLLRTALNTIATYRTSEGLYRTWLAPQDRYQCINPGADPNPADIGIQMHVFQLLSQTDRTAAGALCRALNRAVDDDRIWVYYKFAPLIPMLREADLNASGCSVRLPPAREKTTVPGQELWISAARIFLRMHGMEGPAPAHSEVRELLGEFARDDFAWLRQSPPLLYHNDDTASLPRFYWSEDFGYALWLRLYYQDGPGSRRVDAK